MVRTIWAASVRSFTDPAQGRRHNRNPPSLSLPATFAMIGGEIVTRFAPSPTGFLHLGHVRSALEGWRAARESGGRFLLRIEDIDRGRCREEYAAAIIEDLTWLGLDWDGPVRRQSEHFDDYRRASGAARCAPGAIPVLLHAARNPSGNRAGRRRSAGGSRAGLSRQLSAARSQRIGQQNSARASISRCASISTRAVELTGTLEWIEEADGEPHCVTADPTVLGDVVLARKETPASYHLAVTVDDASQGVTLVTRGRDLAIATHIHRLLQALLGLPTPRYRHHRLLTDAAGRRLAKRD